MKIMISDEAALNLAELLKQHTEYDCVRLALAPSHCGHQNVEVILDEIDSSREFEHIKGLCVMYDTKLKETISEIELAFKDNGFIIKGIPIDQAKKDCSTTGCGGGCCGKCGK